MIKVKNEIKVCEINNKEVDWPKNSIQVLSHWNDDNKVVLVIDDKCYTVSANDLEAAIKNATNINRYL